MAASAASVSPVRPAFFDLWRTAEASGTPGRSREPEERISISPEARERSATGETLDAAEQAEVQRLRETDQRVRAHERAHQAAGGGAAGAATFSYTLGPDGKLYATGGEVPIRVASGRSPDETIAAAGRMRAAALAPPDPSAQDLAVAAQAAQMEAQARAEKSREATGAGAAGQAASRYVTAYEKAVAGRYGAEAATAAIAAEA